MCVHFPREYHRMLRSSLRLARLCSSLRWLYKYLRSSLSEFSFISYIRVNFNETFYSYIEQFQNWAKVRRFKFGISFLSTIERGQRNFLIHIFPDEPPRQTHLVAVVHKEKNTDDGKTSKRKEILALFRLTGTRGKFELEFANKGKTSYPANGRAIR